MRDKESEKFERIGGSYLLIVFAIAIVLPLACGLVMCIIAGEIRLDVIFMLAGGIGFMVWVVLLMLIAWGHFSGPFIKKTAKNLSDYPYRFDSSFKSRGGILYIDVANGMIGFISAYNPFKIQIFKASRIDRIRTVASVMTGVRFVFYLDGKKITMPTLLTNRMVNLKSGIGAEAVEKADTFVAILNAAKERAEGVYN